MKGQKHTFWTAAGKTFSEYWDQKLGEFSPSPDLALSLFADDVKMICSTKDVALTQHYLDKLNEWQKTWLLNFNT